MKISKVSVVALVILIGILTWEIKYFKGKSSDDRAEAVETEVEVAVPTEENLTMKREQEEKRILLIVHSYQDGYKDGCPANAKMRKVDPSVSEYERAYILGFEKGKKACSGKRAEQIQQEQFTKGEKDGCSTSRGNPIQNKELYLQKKGYQKGWDKGYGECKKVGTKEVEVKQEKKKKPAKVKINRKSPEYQYGYWGGCDSSGGKFHRDEELYLQSREYRAGWTEGRKKCSERSSAVPNKREKPSKSNYFDLGYDDGCDTAEGFFRRDRYKYDRYRSYRNGWNLGRRECDRRQMEQRLPPPLPFPPLGF